MRTLAALAALLAVSACAQSEGPEPVPPDRTPVAQVMGPPVNCLTTTQINDTRVWNDRTIDFHVAGGQTYRNTLPNACPELGFEERFAYTLSQPRLCSLDIITVLHSDGSRGASCGLGEFVPVGLAPRNRP